MTRERDEREVARAAARLAVGAYARYPSDANARRAQQALRRLRKLALAARRGIPLSIVRTSGPER
jgi:hypothetical protein